MKLIHYICILLTICLFASCKQQIPSQFAKKKYYEVKNVDGRYYLPKVGRKVLVSTSNTHVKLHTRLSFDEEVVDTEMKINDDVLESATLYFDKPGNSYGVDREYSITVLNTELGLQKWQYCGMHSDDCTFVVVDADKAELLPIWDNELPEALTVGKLLPLYELRGDYCLMMDCEETDHIKVSQNKVLLWDTEHDVDLVYKLDNDAIGIKLKPSRYLDESHITRERDDAFYVLLKPDSMEASKWRISLYEDKISEFYFRSLEVVNNKGMYTNHEEMRFSKDWIKYVTPAYFDELSEIDAENSYIPLKLYRATRIRDPKAWRDVRYPTYESLSMRKCDYNGDELDDILLINSMPLTSHQEGISYNIDILEKQGDGYYRWVVSLSTYITHFNDVSLDVDLAEGEFVITLDNKESRHGRSGYDECRTYTWLRNPSDRIYYFKEATTNRPDLHENEDGECTTAFAPLHKHTRIYAFNTSILIAEEEREFDTE